MNGERELVAELSALAGEPAPPSRVDVHAALQRGRARVLRRRVAVLTAATAVVVSSVALAAVLPGNGRATGPAVQPTVTVTPSPSGVNTWNPVPLPGPTVAPSGSREIPPLTGIDPLVFDARFGWLPDSIKRISYSANSESGSANAQGDPGKPESASFILKVYPAGVTPELAGSAIRIGAPPVGGREAYWVTDSDPDMAKGLNLLRWRTAEGRWAELYSGGLSGGDRQQLPLRVAAGVTTGHWQVPLPLRISGMPKTYAVASVTLKQSRDGKDFALEMRLQTASNDFIAVDVKPDGMPVLQQPTTCKSERGAKVCVTPLENVEHVLDPAGGPQGLLDRITLFGTDPTTWSTAVLG